jgi:hypothetical protein
LQHREEARYNASAIAGKEDLLPIVVLIPSEISDICNISEALLWVAFNRFPLPFGTENKLEARVDPEYIDGLEPYLPGMDLITDDECRQVGLPPNPEYEDFEADTYRTSVEDLQRFLKFEGLTDQQRQQYRNELEDSIAFGRRQAAWQAAYDAFIDVHEAKLFVALRENRVKALGRKLPRRTFAGSLKRLEATNWAEWDDTNWEPIPADFWISRKINWTGCWAEGNGNTYGLIIVETESLLNCFPPPPAERFGGVVKVANDLVLVPDGEPQRKTHQTRGRPSFDWDAFHVEVARRIKDGSLPQKQEAFILELQLWCKGNWNRDVGRSTILQKLRPYYDVFVRQSENHATEFLTTSGVYN